MRSRHSVCRRVARYGYARVALDDPLQPVPDFPEDGAPGPPPHLASGGRAHSRALLVGGREVVRDGALPGVDIGQRGARARAAVARLIA